VDNAGSFGRQAQAGPVTGTGNGPTGGFQGSIRNLPLVDLLQVWSLNHFSGMVRVTSLGRTGHIYFLDGEVVHAEANGASGEEAVRTVIAWADGTFEPFPNTTTLKRTIQKRLSHLLLDAHRELDERRHQGEAPPAGAARATPPPLREGARPSALDQIRAIRGVARLVRFGADGRPTDGEGGDAEALAAKGLYLALNHAAAVSQAFGLRNLVMASVEGERESFVVVHAQGRYLAVAVEAGIPVEPIASQIRALLSRPAAR